jgi:YD repeat-containing protein
LSQVTSYAYDNLYRRTSITDALSGMTSFAYDAVGNMTSLTDPVGNTTNWTRDALDRVTAETNQFGDSRFFAYDPAGNLTQRTDRNGRVAAHISPTEWDIRTLWAGQETWPTTSSHKRASTFRKPYGNLLRRDPRPSQIVQHAPDPWHCHRLFARFVLFDLTDRRVLLTSCFRAGVAMPLLPVSGEPLAEIIGRSGAPHRGGVCAGHFSIELAQNCPASCLGGGVAFRSPGRGTT